MGLVRVWMLLFVCVAFLHFCRMYPNYASTANILQHSPPTLFIDSISISFQVDSFPLDQQSIEIPETECSDSCENDVDMDESDSCDNDADDNEDSEGMKRQTRFTIRSFVFNS